MSSFSGIIYPEVLRSIDTATFTGAFQKIGTPLDHADRILKFTNTSNVAATISWDGVNAHEFIPAGSFLLLDICTNRGSVHEFEIQQGTQLYASGTAGVGLLYLSCYFAR